MKRIIAFLLAVMMVASIAPAAFAAEQDTTTTLTTTVPGATYEFSFPADTTIKYNALDTSIGYLEVTQSSGFAVGKNLQITMEYGPFTNADGTSTIPYVIKPDVTTIEDTETHDSHYGDTKPSGTEFIFKGMNDGQVKRLASVPNPAANDTATFYGDLGVIITQSAWGKALAGEHTSIITFTAAVVQD